MSMKPDEEMIEAGVRVYLEHCPDTGVGDRLDRKMIAEIYEAMNKEYDRRLEAIFERSNAQGRGLVR